MFEKLKRLGNLIGGKADRAVENMEASDPDAIYRTAIAEQEKEIEELTDLARQGKGLVFQKDEQTKDVQSQLDEIQTDLKLAIEQEDEELGPDLMQQEAKLEERIEELTLDRNELDEDANDTVKARDAAVAELKELKEEHQQAAAMEASHGVMQRIQDRKDGLASDATSKSLGTARSRIAAMKAAKMADKATKGTSMDDKRAALREKAGDSQASSNFAALIAKKKKKGGK